MSRLLSAGSTRPPKGPADQEFVRCSGDCGWDLRGLRFEHPYRISVQTRKTRSWSEASVCDANQSHAAPERGPAGRKGEREVVRTD